MTEIPPSPPSSDSPPPLSPRLQALVVQVEGKAARHHRNSTTLLLEIGKFLILAVTILFADKFSSTKVTLRDTVTMAGAMTLFNFSASFCNRLRLHQKKVDQLCESDSVRVLPALLAVYNTVKS
ncbi:MAG: hypothetical protein H7308_03875, partial [Chthonomonadaceae bacterium]|nr:hypothetical protein [Chthonomonadaceae bacterium]